MKTFPKAKHFVDDVNFLCGVIFNSEFHTDGYFYQRAMEIYRGYSWTEESNTFDVTILISEFMDNVEIQSIEGMQNAFDIWKAILNGIHLPDCDLFNYAEATKEKGHREDGMSILELLLNLCGCLRREVETLMKDYHLQNRSHTTHFLTPPFYEMGDVGYNAIDAFRTKYEGYINNLDKFLEIVKTINGRHLVNFYKEKIFNYSIPLKEFINDVLKITPERKGERGWNYDAIKKYN